MEIEILKVRISVLWIFIAVAILGYYILYLVVPGVIEGVIAGELLGAPIDETFLLIYSLLLIIPLTMAFLSLILKESINRWVNIIVAIGWILIGTMNLLNSGYIAVGLHLFDAAMYIVAVLIIWYAWKLKKD